MKKLLLMLLAFHLGMGAVSAQKSGKAEAKPQNQYTAEERTLLALRQLTTKLNLTDEQVNNIKPYLEAREKARENFRNNREDEPSITAFKEAKSKFHAALKDMLNAEQLEKWQEIKKQKREQNQNRKGERNPDRHFDPEEF